MLLAGGITLLRVCVCVWEEGFFLGDLMRDGSWNYRGSCRGDLCRIS